MNDLDFVNETSIIRFSQRDKKTKIILLWSNNKQNIKLAKNIKAKQLR